MSDAHVGIGATVGSVIPTSGAVIPSGVGVDIGGGMIAADLDVTDDQLPDSLEAELQRRARSPAMRRHGAGPRAGLVPRQKSKSSRRQGEHVRRRAGMPAKASSGAA